MFKFDGYVVVPVSGEFRSFCSVWPDGSRSRWIPADGRAELERLELL
jgi:hypothetical protein